MAGQVMSPSEKILILLSLCDHWTWNRPINRSIEGSEIRPAAVVKLWYGNREGKFSYGHGLTESQKYRRLLRAVQFLGVPLPEFGYEDLDALVVR